MLWKTPAALCPMISKYREIVVPMTVEYRNGVQSSTISYSNMVIPEAITKTLKKKKKTLPIPLGRFLLNLIEILLR